jgi:NADPH2:quinone reductase
MRAVQITEFGGPEVLTVVDLPEPEVGQGQTLHDVSTAGVNYADTHHRWTPLFSIRWHATKHPGTAAA